MPVPPRKRSSLNDAGWRPAPGAGRDIIRSLARCPRWWSRTVWWLRHRPAPIATSSLSVRTRHAAVRQTRRRVSRATRTSGSRSTKRDSAGAMAVTSLARVHARASLTDRSRRTHGSTDPATPVSVIRSILSVLARLPPMGLSYWRVDCPATLRSNACAHSSDSSGRRRVRRLRSGSRRSRVRAGRRSG